MLQGEREGLVRGNKRGETNKEGKEEGKHTKREGEESQVGREGKRGDI